MKKATRRLILIGTISVLSMAVISFAMSSSAKFVEGKKTDQSAYGLGGERQTSIFFNANVWKQGKDSAGNIVDASYYLYVWKSTNQSSTEKTLIPAAHVTPTITGQGGAVMDLYVFEFDTTKYDRLRFLRWDPAISPSTDMYYGTDHGLWNRTVDITSNSTINYYCIDAWGDTMDYGHAVATPNTNYIYKNPSTGILSWGYHA